MFLDCLKHFKDMCFQCAYYKLCGNSKKIDCETVEKTDLKKSIEKETKLIQGIVLWKKNKGNLKKTNLISYKL